MIVLTGAHGTGKTTITSNLRPLIGDSWFITESSTRRSGIKTDMSATDSDQLALLESIKQYEIDNQLFDRKCFLDRSMIDFYAYTRFLHITGQVSDQTESIIRLEFEKRLPLYEKIFYLPIEFGIKSDGVRPGSVDYQYQIDLEIKSIIEEYGLLVIELTGSVDERVDKIVNELEFEFTSNIDIDLGEAKQYLSSNNFLLRDINTGVIKSLVSFDIGERIKIGYVYTNPDYRGCGYASYLLHRVIDKFNGYDFYFYIKEQALPFYHKFGLVQHIKGKSIYTTDIDGNYLCYFKSDNGIKYVPVNTFISDRLE